MRDEQGGKGLLLNRDARVDTCTQEQGSKPETWTTDSHVGQPGTRTGSLPKNGLMHVETELSIWFDVQSTLNSKPHDCTELETVGFLKEVSKQFIVEVGQA